MKIHIENLKFQSIIGILDFERVTPQDVIINLEIEYNYVDKFINYADVVELIINNMKEEKFLLIEDALSSLTKELKSNFSLIEKLSLKITKPSILSNCKVSVSSMLTFNKG